MSRINVEWFASDIKINDIFSDNEKTWLHTYNFDYDETSIAEIENVFLRMYICDKKCSLDEAIKWNIIQDVTGALRVNWCSYWYSEYTIMWYEIYSSMLWWHNLEEIIESHKWKYLHIIIDFNWNETSTK